MLYRCVLQKSRVRETASRLQPFMGPLDILQFLQEPAIRSCLNPWSRDFEKIIVAQLIKKLLRFMEPEGSVPWPPVSSATGSYPRSDEFNIILSFQSSRVKKSKKTSWPFKMGPISYPETSVHNYHSTLRNIPEERRSRLDRGGGLKSRNLLSICGRKRDMSVCHLQLWGPICSLFDGYQELLNVIKRLRGETDH
jgi:hypothetical protein